MLTEYKDYIKKSLRPKRVPMSPGIVLKPEDCPTIPDPHKQKIYRSFVAKPQFAATWIRLDIAFPVSQLAYLSLPVSVLPQDRVSGPCFTI